MPSYLKSSRFKYLYASLRAYLLARNIIKIYKKLNPNNAKSKIKIFEIGPGRADLALALINKLNPNYYICDIDKSIIDFCKKRVLENYGSNNISFDQIPVSDLNTNSNDFDLFNFFDIAISSHVIEHLEDMNEHLILLKKLVKPKGLIYLASPNTASLAAKKYGNKWKGYQDPTHISLHSLHDILKLIDKLDLEIIISGTSPITIKDYLPFNTSKLFFSKSGLGSSYNLICQKKDS